MSSTLLSPKAGSSRRLISLTNLSTTRSVMGEIGPQTMGRRAPTCAARPIRRGGEECRPEEGSQCIDNLGEVGMFGAPDAAYERVPLAALLWICRELSGQSDRRI